MKSKKLFLQIFLFGVLVCPTALLADDEDGLDYNAIVNELSKPKPNVSSGRTSSDDVLDNVEIHTGIAMASTTFGVNDAKDSTTQVTQRGFQVSLGIDLFSPYWMAEGTMQNYFEREYEKSQISLQEFDLKVFYKNRFDTSIGYKIGTGLAARYMAVKTKEYGEQKYTTPSALAAVGLDFFVSRHFSIGGEAIARNSLTYETPDQASVDFLLRLDAHL